MTCRPVRSRPTRVVTGRAGPIRRSPSWTEEESLLEAAFAAAGVLRVSHDRSGIRIGLPTSPAESLVARLTCALKLAAFLARSNR